MSRFLLGMLFFASGAFAQTTSSQILGTIQDSSGAAISGARIEATRKATSETRTVESNESGSYVISSLESGEYALVISAPGFQSERVSSLRVELSQIARVNATLRVGNVTETIEVQAVAPVLNTDDATLGEVVGRKQIVELPLNGRNFAQLATITTPGVRIGYSTFGNGIRLYAGGQRENQNQFTLSGIVVQNNLINAVSFRPSVEALEEFKVQTGNFSAELGMYSGAQVTMNLRAGTNDLHGTLFEFLRNERMDARNFFEDPAVAKAPLRRNQFGFVVSGPVFIPKLYNGKSRTFFMVNGEYLRHRLASVGLAVVPTPAFRQGDFSALAATVRDPITKEPFAGNRIPPSRLNASALALQNYYPLPNQAGTTNFRTQTKSDTDNNQFLTRIDQVLGSKDRLYGSYIYQTNNNQVLATLPSDVRSEPTADWSVALNETHLFGPTVINEFRLGYTRLNFNNSNNFTGSDFSIREEFGMIGFPEGDPRLAGLPGISITGMLGLSSSGPLLQVDETAQLTDNLSVVASNHMIKMGYDTRRGRIARRSANWPRGVINFTGEMTGVPYADFLLGLPRRSDGVEAQNWAEARNWRHGLYLADDWKVNSRITLNLGVRYELFTVPYDPYGRLRSLDPNDGSRLIPEPYVPAKLFKGDHNNWAPRIGFAVRATSKTVLRGGYGIYYNANQLNNFTLLQSNPPFRLAPTVFSDPANPTVSLSDPYQTGGQLPTGPFNIATVDPSLELPNAYTQNYSFLIQQEVLPQTTLEVGYVGSQSKHVDRSDSGNLASPGPGAIQARRPLPMWADVRVIRNDVTASYNSLQSTLRRRMSSGVTFVGTYAWSKVIDDGNDFNSGARAQDPEKRFLERGPSQFDFTHRLTGSFVWELPFFASSNGLRRTLLGGWQLNGIYILESGRPFSISTAGDRANSGSSAQRADRVADGRLSGSERRIERWFDTAAFRLPQQYTYGNSGRHILRGPITNTFDFGAIKNFRIREHHVMQLRGEFFGLTNTPNFGLPGATLDTPLFGVITSATGNRNVQLGLKYSF